MREREVVDAVEHELAGAKRAFFNIHGSSFGRAGTPDFLTHDAAGVMLGVECKAPGAEPVVSQWRVAIEMLKAGLRYAVAYDDFSIAALDAGMLPKVAVGSRIGESEFEARGPSKAHSYEVVLECGEDDGEQC